MLPEMEKAYAILNQNCLVILNQYAEQQGLSGIRRKLFVNAMLDKSPEVDLGYRQSISIELDLRQCSLYLYRFSYDDGDCMYFDTFNKLCDFILENYKVKLEDFLDEEL
jgi:hypothetical protein